jgi:hypothetical protein
MKKVFTPIAFLLLYLLKSNPVSAQCGFSISTTVTNVTCNGSTNGSIAVSITGVAHSHINTNRQKLAQAHGAAQVYLPR